MPISVQLRKERGEVVVALGEPYRPDPLSLDPARFPLLSGIDPYGFTVFNSGQMARLAEEIRDLLPDVPQGQRERLTMLALTCQRGQSPPHQYLWFLGD